MNNKFTLTESLSKLKNKNYQQNISSNIDRILEKYGEEQLLYLSMNGGILLDNSIIKLSFYQGIGFRCHNEGVDKFGRLPVCNNIEKFLNDIYINSKI